MCLFVVFPDRVSLCSLPVLKLTVDQAGLELRERPASASPVWGLRIKGLCLLCRLAKDFFCFVLFFGFLRQGFSVALAVLELRNLPASPSQVLGLKACATFAHFIAQLNWVTFFLLLASKSSLYILHTISQVK